MVCPASAPQLGCITPTMFSQRPAFTTHALPAGIPSFVGCALSMLAPSSYPSLGVETYPQVIFLIGTDLRSEHGCGNDCRWE